MANVNRRDFIKLAGSAALATGLQPWQQAAGAAEQNKPNVIFMFADQMRAQAMGCAGNTCVDTPNLDRMAAEGLHLTNAISCEPICTPFRGQLLTGRYPHTTGITDNDIRLPDDEMTVGEAFKNGGYRTGYIGKWHLAGYRNDPVDKKNRRGWDYWAVENCDHNHFHFRYYDAEEKKHVMKGWEPYNQTDLATDFIQENRDNPFCLFMSFGPPHNPYTGPESLRHLYHDVPDRPNLNKGERWQYKHITPYYQMINSLDQCVGRIIDALKENGIDRNTIVCFSSDHGDMLQSQGHRRKRRPWEESINIPFIARYPDGIPPGRQEDFLFASVDIMPTLLGLAGVPIPDGVEGWNMADAFMQRGNPEERDAVFLFHNDSGDEEHQEHRWAVPDWRGIRTKEWVYAYHTKGEWVLYNLRDDPYELNNLIDDPKYAEKKKELRERTEQMRRELGEDIPLIDVGRTGIKLPPPRV